MFLLNSYQLPCIYFKLLFCVLSNKLEKYLTSLLSSFQHQHVLYGRIPMRYQHGLSRNTMYHYITPHWILVSATQRPMQVEKHLAHQLEPRLLGDDSILTNHTMHLTILTLLVITQGGLNHLHHKQNFSR